MSDKLVMVKDNGASGLALQRIEAGAAKTMLDVPAVDTTLAVSGAAADAKVSGDRIRVTDYLAKLDLVEENVDRTMVRRIAISINAKEIVEDAGSAWYTSEPITVTAGEVYRLWCSGYGSRAAYAFANDQGIQYTYPESWSSTTAYYNVDGEQVEIPQGITKLYISRNTGGSISSAKVTKYAAKDVPDGAAVSAYLGDFTTNKAGDLTWLDGYSVYKIDMNKPRPDSGYSIVTFECKKGDYIKVTYAATRNPGGNRYVLSEKVIYGSGEMQYGFNGILIGVSTQDVYEYVCERDMTVTVCARTSYKPQIICYAVPAYGQSSEFSEDRYKRFEFNAIQDKLVISKAARNNFDDTVYPKPLTLLHYSDIHNAFYNTKNIADFLKMYGSVIDDAILTGDLTGYFANYRPMYALEDYKKILLCIGNHDVYDADGSHEGGAGYDNPEYWATNIQKYNQYFAPNIEYWNVTQPADAETNGLCYYYKDYESNGYGYRLIVLDAMAFDDAQYSWLTSVLTDAKTNSLTVVIADHFPPITSLANIAGFNTPFMSLLTGMEYAYSTTFLTSPGGYKAVDAVDDFIDGGGEFACWICGHMHYDQIATLTTHPNQIYVAVASANRSAVWLDSPRVRNTPSEDCFNIISIDPYRKLIKIERIGAVTDDWGRKHDHVCINYATRSLIATS